MPTDASSRSYSAPPSIHNVANLYAWNPTAVVNTNTGNWVPLTMSGNALATVPVVATYTSSPSLIVGTGQVILPLTTKQWSVSVISGVAYVGTAGPLVAGATVGGGGFDGRSTFASTLAVGATGAGAGTPCVLVSYDV